MLQEFSAKIWSLGKRKKKHRNLFLRRATKKSKNEKFRKLKIREIMDVRDNISEVMEDRRLRWFGHLERMKINRTPKTVE